MKDKKNATVGNVLSLFGGVRRERELGSVESCHPDISVTMDTDRQCRHLRRPTSFRAFRLLPEL